MTVRSNSLTLSFSFLIRQGWIASSQRSWKAVTVRGTHRGEPMGIATTERLGQAVPLEDLRGFIREFVPKRSFSPSHRRRGQSRSWRHCPNPRPSGVRVFGGSLAFGSEESRCAASKRFLSLDLRETADAGVGMLQRENSAG